MDNHNFILIVDYFFNYTTFIFMQSNYEANKITKLLLTHIYEICDILCTILSNIDLWLT